MTHLTYDDLLRISDLLMLTSRELFGQSAIRARELAEKTKEAAIAMARRDAGLEGEE